MQVNYVIAAWSGPRRSGGDGVRALKKQIDQLELLKHDLAQITIVVPYNEAEPTSFAEYLSSLSSGNLPIVILRRKENVGVSYGCWSYAYDVFGKQFDHYLFMEDDYYFVEDHFDRTLVKLLRGHGLVCGYVSSAYERRWPGNSNGMATTEALEAVKAKYGKLPYDAQVENGSYTLESGQVEWGVAFQKCGYKIKDITEKYACLHNYWERRACDIIPGQPANDRFLFVPFEAPMNYPFMPFRRRHQGYEGILYGTGPSLNDYDFREDDGSRIRVGLNSFITEKRKIDYYFFGHMDARSAKYLRAVKAFRGIKFGYTKVDGNARPTWLNPRQALDLRALPFELTENIYFHDDIAAKPMVNHAINFAALQFMVYSGMKKIYLVGCDCSQVISNRDSGLDKNRGVEVLVEAWKKFAEYAKDRVEVVSVNPVALKDLFPSRYT
jgi:hypothetical protein